jgi:DNA replication and repair protein RecF
MFLKNISLINFKNYPSIDLEFSENINCFVGNNGVGKTNLLDAIHYLSFCKSYFNVSDALNIMHDTDFFTISGIFAKNEGTPDNVLCNQKLNHRKVFKLNKKEYDRLADHIGLFPLVMVSPYDADIIYGGSEERRKFLDSFISQFDRIYLDNLINYNKALFQRNKLLKIFFENKHFDAETIEIWDNQLVMLGHKIFEKRKEFIRDFLPYFSEYYNLISGSRETVELNYNSQLSGKPMSQLLSENLHKDRAVQYTTHGIHKDDLDFFIFGYPLKKFGSQGQQKSFTIAIKLAQFQYIQQMKSLKPILLFDDIFDKLDDLRVEQLIKLAADGTFGQVFITDTQPERMVKNIQKMGSKGRIFEINSNNATEITLYE